MHKFTHDAAVHRSWRPTISTKQEAGDLPPFSGFRLNGVYLKSSGSDPFIVETRHSMAKTAQTARDAVSWLRARLGTTAPDSVDAGEVRLFAEYVENVAIQLAPNPSLQPTSPDCDARLTCMTSLMHWLVTKATPEAIVQLMAATRAPPHERDWRTTWNSLTALALRSALVKTPDSYYDRVTALGSEICSEQRGLALSAYFAFVLADDRARRHDLQPFAVLNAAADAGKAIPGVNMSFTALMVDSSPAAVARWRMPDGNVPFPGNCAIPITSIGATAVMVARHHHQAALPVLQWLMENVHYSARTELARIILAIDEEGALESLLPQLQEKWIQTALDQSERDNPAQSFRQCLNVVAAGNTNLQLKARVMAVIRNQPVETLRQWAGSGPKALSYLERAFVGPDALAEPDSWPAVLRDPPWRRKAKVVDDIVLELLPIATPFAFHPGREGGNELLPYARIVQSSDELPAFIEECETRVKNAPRIPAPTVPPPQPGATENQILAWLSQRLLELGRKDFLPVIVLTGYGRLFYGVERQPDALAFMLWECAGSVSTVNCTTSIPRMFARFGERALPGLLKQLESNLPLLLEHTQTTDAVAIVPFAARALSTSNQARPLATAWLRRYRRTAITRLIPDAVGSKGETRNFAEHALRWLASTDGGRTEIETIAADYAKVEPRLHDVLAQVLDRDPLSCYPAKIAQLPNWLVPSALHRPELVSGGALPDEAVTAFAEMLSFSTPDAIYAGIAIVRQQTTRRSCAAFAWDLFSTWLANGAPANDSWAMRAVGWLGDDECTRHLTQLIRKWPGESAHARAVTGLDVLVDIGSDIALMNVTAIAEKLKLKGLQAKAREKIAALAEARDLSPEELSDRLAPDLDLDERGGLDLIFGERRFRAGFDEFLKPWIKDATGQRLKDLPKPNKSDDAEISAEAVTRWKALKKDARSIACLQITRLENMLSTSRRTKPEVFWTFFASHPLIRHLAQRLVWGVYADDNPRTRPTTTFRITDDLSFTSSGDTPLEIDVSEDATGRIGLVHPLHLSPEVLEAWGALVGDYEIAQPFPQLSREIFELTEAEEQASEINRFEGVTVEAARIRGVGSYGWQLGAPKGPSLIHWIEREVRMEDGTVSTATLDFAHGFISSRSPEYDGSPRLGKLCLGGPYRSTNRTRHFGELDPVELSELLRGPHLLVAAETS